MIVPDRDEFAKPPMRPYRYFKDEVNWAREITGKWSVCMLHGMDYNEIMDWRRALEVAGPKTWLSGAYDRAPDDAIALAAGGVRPGDLEWRYGDDKHGMLAERLRRNHLTIDEVIVEVEARRATPD